MGTVFVVGGGGLRGVCVRRFNQWVGGRIFSRMKKCVNHILPVSFIRCIKSPCVELTSLIHCGYYKLDIFHYQPFFVVINPLCFIL